MVEPVTLFERLAALDLPPSDYAIFGSGPLIVRGIIAATNDLDVLCRGSAWDQVSQLGNAEYLPEHEIEIVSLDNGHLTFGTRWAIGDFNSDELIDTAEIIDGLPFVRLRFVVNYKVIASREKDLEHLDALKLYEARVD